MQNQFNEETLAALKDLGQTLRAIHDRLIAEGYTIVDGVYVLPEKGSNLDSKFTTIYGEDES